MTFAASYIRRLNHFNTEFIETRALANLPATTFPPGAICKAYSFLTTTQPPKSTAKYGIVSLGGNISSSDIQTFCQNANYPMPKVLVVPVNGAPIKSDPGGANTENMLDVQMVLQAWHYTYPTTPCDIVVGMARNIGTGIGDSANSLDQHDCTDISISWGAAEQRWGSSDRAYTEAVFKNILLKGKTICAASGDNSANNGMNVLSVDYPCGSLYVWGCGGTNLTAPNGVWQAEKAWGDGRAGDEGGGGGFDPISPIPFWQKGVVPGSKRGCPDSSANADPKTGYQIYSDGGWTIVGGTSAVAPLMCGYFGALRAMGMDLSGFQAKLYEARLSCWRDVLTGSNGFAAASGWDAVTGLGSPIGPGIAAALVPNVPPSPPPPQPPTAEKWTITYSNGLAVGSTGTYSVLNA